MNEETLRLVTTEAGDVHCMHCGLVAPWVTVLVVVRPTKFNHRRTELIGQPFVVACSIDCLAAAVAFTAGRELVDNNKPEPLPRSERPERRTLMTLLAQREREYTELGYATADRCSDPTGAVVRATVVPDYHGLYEAEGR